jgi:hypothetical protein
MPIAEKKVQPSYPNELVEIAQQVGYKAANLEFLDKILLEFRAQEQNHIAIEVPKHISISNQAITSHLEQYASNWRNQWDEFCETQGNDENLKPEALAKLKEIQANIHQAFTGSKVLEIKNLDQNES